MIEYIATGLSGISTALVMWVIRSINQNSKQIACLQAKVNLLLKNKRLV